MTPEQRARRISREVEGRGIWKNAAETELLIASAIRAAENAALEEAARRVEGRPYMSTFPEAVASIRALKSRAPRTPAKKPRGQRKAAR